MNNLNMYIYNSRIEIHGAAVFLILNFFFCPMGDGKSSKKTARTIEMENLSLDIPTNRFSRDLLQRFMGNSSNEYEGAKEENEEIELNLGLSLGGRFGIDKSSNKLVRSSSIASCLPVVRDDNDVVAPPLKASYTGLVRTSSLPVETEEQWRKRKELQTLRRMEAKRRRSEKQRNLKEGGISRGVSLSLEERKEIEVNLRGRLEREKSLSVIKKQGSTVGSQSGLSTWVNQAIIRGGIDLAMVKGKGSFVGSGDGIESKGGSSSSVSDLESKTLQGSSGELSSASIQSTQEGTTNHKIGTRKTSGPEPSKTRSKETGSNPLEDMPCVFTKGDGPNGKRVDGILYKYGKGEEVRIMCVCHGNFHSPVEFVKHAGGTDTDNPLKHIVVNPNASGML